MSLIVLEGLDGSGKGTQTKLLAESLEGRGVPLRHVTFPDYDSPSSALVRMYLDGEFGSEPEDVNAYAASTFYAVDRYASYKQVWGEYYQSGGLVLADRYTTSNAVHQASKLPPEQREDFFRWLEDFEYGKLGLPKPDLVCYLEMDRKVSEQLLEHRYQGDESKRDIHERDRAYLEQCRISADYAAEHWNWRRVACCQKGQVLGVEEITQTLWELTRPFWNKLQGGDGP